MPSNVTAKIRSALKQRETVTLLLTAAVFTVAVFGFQHMAGRERKMTVGGHAYTLEVATSSAQQDRGLSGRKNLAKDKGMLFIFKAEDKHCFWMKDMQFPLDIIWLDGERRVVHVERNVSPDTYPNAICPSEKAVFVIELNAGQSSEAGILEGQVVTF
jgi:uncharacterized membrane protein (UPF0127 family)